MVSKNNFKNKMEQTAARTPHYGIRKLSVGVASVLISTTLYMGATTAKADTLPSTATDTATTKPETASSSSSAQDNATADNTAKTTVTTTASSTDTSVSTTPNAQASTTNTTTGATSSDKSGANNNSLVTNNVESTANTTAQTQPKPDVVTSDKANVGNQVGSNVENKTTTTTGTISTPTTPKRVVRRVRSLAAAPTTVNDPVDLTKWEYNVDSLGDAHVLSYNGDVTQPIYIPNSYDFIQAGKITAEHKAFITSDNMQKLAGSGTHELYISKNGNGKVIAEDSDWHGTFCGIGSRSGRNAQLSETIGKNLEKLDLTNLDVTNIQNMKNMFSFNSQLTSIGDLSNWDTHNVTDMRNMFLQASSLTNIGDLSNWDTHNVTDMNSMFSQASSLTNIGDLSNWDTHDVTNMSSMFSDTYNLTNIGDLSNWDTHNVTDMRDMFLDTSSLTNIGDLSNWDTHNVTNMSGMFFEAFSLTNIGDLSNWDTHNVTNMRNMFLQASSLTNIGDLSNWDTHNVTNMNGMFTQASSLTNIGDLSNWDTHNVTDMSSMFMNTYNLTNIGDLSNWDTHNVTNMNSMFTQASSLTNIGDLSNWDTHNVTDMSSMFLNTYNLTNIGDLSNWNVNNVIDSEDMMFAFGKDSKEPILQKLPSFTKTKDSSSKLPIASTGTGVYDARGITSDVQRTSADNYWNNHIVLTSDTSLLDHSNISNNVNSKINQITINGNKIALPVFYKDYQDLHDTVQKSIDNYAEKLRSQGKIVKSTPKVADYSTEPTADWLKYFTNYTIDVVSKTKINYVDTDGNTIHTTVIEGKSGETVSVPNEIPTGYKLVAGLSVPTEITFTTDDYPITNLAIEAIHTTVTADNPKTTADKLPDNPTKNYPEGVSESDLNKTVTRTINITDPRTQKVTPVVQTVHLTRSADVDEITGKVVYSDWTTSSFDSYNVPEVPGYTATVQSIDEAPVDINSKDQTVDVSYTANPQSIKVNYVDSDNNDSVVKSDTLSGKTDQTVKTDIDIPDGYVVEGNVPSDYTFKANNADITIELKHTTVSVTSDSPKTTADKLPDNPSKNYPSGVAENDLNKTVTRTIKMTDPTGKVTTEIQTVHLTRSATVDEVTGDVIYSDWSTDSFDSYDVPVIEGYTASQSKVDTATVTGDTQNSEVNVTYTANPQSIKINYVDDDNGGATVKSDTLNGKTDETVKTGITIPENYSVVGTTPSEYTFKANGNTDITVHLKHVIDTTSEEKTVTRTIKVTDPTGKVTTIPQTTKVTRTVSTDKVTNQKTYGDWTTSSFDSYDVPIVEGYTASQSKVDKATVDGNSKDSEVNITYTANPQSIKINYVDSDNNGSVVKSDTLNGKTDQTVKTGIIIPDGYVVEGNVPSDYTFRAKDNADITIKLKHGTTTITPDSPKTTADKLPDNPSKNYPSGVAENDLNKTVTRTIKITDPKGKVTTETQTVHLTRTATVDEVTGDITYGDWTTGSFDSYDVPSVEGYTASQDKVDTATVTSDTQNSEVNITYTANPQSIKINYVDSDNNDSVVKSDTLNGKTDQTVKTGITIPDGYVIEGNVPNDYTFKASDNTDITVKLKHGTTTVTPDKPKTTGDKLPDNPAKSYPEGVGQNDLNKTVTRTIKVTDPTGKVSTTTQTVHLTRTATVDEVTGKVTYGDWSTGSFDSYVVPSVDGYTASQDKVDTATVTSDTQNSEVNITYTANPQSIKVNYVDSDNGGAMVKSEALSGKTDETIKTNISIPDGYVVEGQVPTDYTFKGKDNADITVHLKHVIDTTSEEKTITRTIKVTNPNGGVMTIPQSAKSTRTVSTDKVTGEVTYGDWSKADLDGYDVPLIEGYTASQPSVAKTTVDGSNEDNVVEINYTPNKQVISIDYVDNGKVIATQVLTGNTDQIVKTNIQSPDKDKYVLVGNNPDTYTFKAKGNEDIRVEVKHVINDSTESKDITRTIIVTRPDGKETTEVQKATVSRTVHTDAVTGAKTYDEWSKATLDKYDVPVVDGYTPSLNVVEGLEVDGNSEDSVVKVGYTANEQTAKIVYVDGDNGNSIVKSDTLTGKTDETVKTGVKVPDGYVVEGNVPTDYTFKSKDNADITVKLKHGTTTVTPDKPKTTNDKLPDNPSKSYPEGVSENNLNKTVTRTIKVTDPKGKVTTTTQTVHLTRTATVDEVTGKVTYGDWTTGSFDSYDVPSVEGYTASQDKVDTDKVTSDSTNSEVNISYTANDQTAKVVYVDEDNGGSTVKTDTLTGKTDETVKTSVAIPDGYVVEGQVPADYTFKAKNNADITVKLKHGTTTVTADNPKTTDDKLPDNPTKSYPSGVAENDLNKTVTRTIKVTDPTGKVTTETQTVHLTRTATVDEVTGKVSYGDWTTGSFDSYVVPSVEGYTASQAKVDEAKVTADSKNSEVNITYTANDQSAKIVYVDRDNGDSIVKTDTLNGKTDQTVKTGIETPDGYVVEGQVPTDYTFKAKDNADITVHLTHNKATVTPDKPKTTADKLPNNPTKSYPDGVGQNDLNKTVTRTIKVTTPDGKTSTTTQTVYLTRTATVDEVTGKVTYSDWTTGSFDSYDVPSVDGYTASQSKVDGTPVTADSSNNEVNISYTANDQSAKIVYVDNGKVVSTQVLTGKTDQTVKTNIQSPDKDKYVVVGDNPENYTFKAKDNEDVRVEVKHVVNTFKDYKNVIRNIEVTYPNGKTEKLAQVTTLERTVYKDAVTGEETYSDWSNGGWDSFKAPEIKGYTADKDVKETVVTGDTTETTVSIVYTANEQATKIVYVDNDKSGSIVKTDTLNGKTDQTVKTDVKVPDGYVIEGNVPDNYTFAAGDNFDIIVHLRHGIVKVTPDKSKTTADKLPDSSKTYPEGVGQDDLNKTITRTIKVTTPDGKTSTTTQTAHLIRTARVDETTGQVTYDDWTTGSFDSYDVPSVDGYTASQAKVEETKVTSDSTNSEVNISYTANKQSIKVVYVDGYNSGSTVKTDTLTGKTDETVKTGIETPDGYEVDGQVPSEYSFKAKDNADITVHLKHSTVTVIPDLPKTTDDKLPNNPTKSYPKGVAKDDLNKTVVRTIKVTTPDGKTTTTRQTVDLNRVAVVDEVTGQVTYSKWSLGELDRYDVPVVDGYTPSQDRVNMEVANSETKDSVVEITYAPNGQSINITYVDDDKGGATVKSYILAGKTDKTVKTGIEIPDGYEVKGDVPADYTFKAKDNADVTVHLKHKLDKGTETKTVSRIVKITLPDGQTKTIKQEQTLKRSKTTDLVTGDVVYGKWSKGEFDEVVVPEIDGYKPSQAKVESKVVDGASSDQVVKVTYEKIKSEAKPTAEVKNEAKVQVAPTAEAKTSAKLQAKAQPKFVTTELPQTGEKQSKGTTIGAILVGLGSLLGLGALGKRKEK
ncbi:BspA family leucine-rich repeat surface protein [Ligilactobacillus salivarius]|nr:BspA family leucine-rich repeat surface protein [Ligilactobacillus salivarius]